MPRIPVEIKIEADALEEMTRRHVDRLMDELGYRCDMRAVVIVEFWAMMAGGLPYAWHWAPSPLTSRSIKPLRCAMHATGADVPSRADWSVDDIWAAEYAARPRMEGA